MTTFRRQAHVLYLLVVVLLLAQIALAQASYTAQLRGLVTDHTGAVIPDAKVTATDNGTNISTTVPTDSSGHYIFSSLRPTTYTLRVESRGFEAAVQKNLVLAVSQQATLNVTLKPAGVATEVQVTDTAPLLDTGSGSLGTEVTNEFVTRIPLQNRDTSQLVYLSAGVTQLNNADRILSARTSPPMGNVMAPPKFV